MGSERELVGKMYCNTFSKKIGVVESWESKYRTFLLRDEEGRSFNVSSATFKRDWEPYNGDVVINTSAQLQDKIDKIESDSEKAVQTLRELVLERAGDRSDVPIEDELGKYARSIKSILDNLLVQLDLVPKYTKLHTEITKKNDVNLKYNVYKIISIWIKPEQGLVCIVVKDDLWKEVIFDEDLGDMKCVYHDSWSMPYLIKRPVEQVEKLLRNYLQAYKRIKEDKCLSKED
jgi:hypothetical protein